MSEASERASDFVKDLGDAARKNPISAALIGMGVVWLFASRTRGPNPLGRKRAEGLGLDFVIEGLRGSPHIELWHPWVSLDKFKMPIRDYHGGKWQKHSRILKFDLPDRNRIPQRPRESQLRDYLSGSRISRKQEGRIVPDRDIHLPGVERSRHRAFKSRRNERFVLAGRSNQKRRDFHSARKSAVNKVHGALHQSTGIASRSVEIHVCLELQPRGPGEVNLASVKEELVIRPQELFERSPAAHSKDPSPISPVNSSTVARAAPKSRHH